MLSLNETAEDEKAPLPLLERSAAAKTFFQLQAKTQPDRLSRDPAGFCLAEYQTRRVKQPE